MIVTDEEIEKMNESSIFDQWLSGKKRLSPDEVKALPEGSKVWIHRIYGSRGEHVFVRATVTQVGKSKWLAYRDNMGLPDYEPIKHNDRVAYTLD